MTGERNDASGGPDKKSELRGMTGEHSVSARPDQGSLTGGKTAGRKCSGGGNAGTGATGWAERGNKAAKDNTAADAAGDAVIASSGTDELFHRLAAVLEKQSSLISALSEAGRRQTEALRVNDLTAFNETVRLQESLAGELAAREKERLKLLAGLPKPPGGEEENRLAVLAAGAPKPLHDKLLALRAQLRAGVRELRQVTDANRYIIHWCRDFNARLLKITAAARGGTYGADGGVSSGQAVTGLDRSV
ncbi:flagellar protein FlgN [Desulfotomaculum copahuensis]|uniref:Flagellar biosynthesis protein FlgN n=1 Tax=Desulfotomaculum copahuensis TaxID=1838280 RepID=A0A1B7LCG3_9FIRM|nr:flagellar protein FlgN [Desulfotomaculum copahuensis]OAT80371.1 hypothetical protein A6M21_13465 [Desulfotomaculum copahuensis]